MKRLMKSLAAALLLLCVMALAMSGALAQGEDMVAQIGSEKYASIQAAVNDAKDGDTIVIIADHEIKGYSTTQPDGYDVLILVGGNQERRITIDFNGKKVTARPSQYFLGAIWVEGKANLTLKDSLGIGKLEVIAGDTKMYCLLANYGKDAVLTVESGNYRLDAAKDSLIYSQYNEVVFIKGGSFTLDNVGWDTSHNRMPWIFNVKGSNAAHTVVTGGTFNYDFRNQHWNYEVKIPKNKGMKDNGNETFTVVDAVAYVEDPVGFGHTNNPEMGFATLKEAIIHGGPSDVHLRMDAPVDETLVIDKEITVDLNDYTLLWEGDADEPILEVKTGGKLKINAFTPKRRGYTCLGLYSDKNLTTDFHFPSSGLEAGALAYGKWEAKDYTITWKNGGANHDTTTQTFDEKLTLPASNPVKGADKKYTYVFAGWYTAAEGGEKVTADMLYQTDSNVTYYAQYTAVPVAPATGDETPLVLYMLLMGAALMGLAWIRQTRKA